MRTPATRGALVWLAFASLAACGGRESLLGGSLDGASPGTFDANSNGGSGKGSGAAANGARGGFQSGGVGNEVGGAGGVAGNASGFGPSGGATFGGSSAGDASAGLGQGGASAGASNAGGFGAGAGAAGAGAFGGFNAGGFAGGAGLASGGSTGGGSTGGTTNGGSGASAASGGGTTGPMLNAPCSPSGALACHGAAQRLRLLCDAGLWRTNGTCSEAENCNQATGVCSPIVPQCAGWAPGTRFCSGEFLMECGPDIVDAAQIAECDGSCVETAFSASCVPATCNDGRIQEPEECDDGNFIDSDACTNACRFATCGDGALWTDHEACDDGNLTPADACSVVCGREPDSVAAANYHSCALGKNGRVQCWGQSSMGQLGLGDTLTRGDTTNEMGTRLPLVELGTNQTVTALFSAYQTSCAILAGGALKCWGYNGRGGLGLGDTASRGAQVAQMGDALPQIPLGRPVLSVAIGDAHTCALLDDNSVKCWGYNAQGQLGIGSSDNRGDVPNEMESLPSVNLGSGVTAKAIAAGSTHTCALLNDDHVKCWGSNSDAQLGQGDLTYRGSDPAQMGDALPRIDLGEGRTARSIGAGDAFTCALLSDASVRCWGRNTYGGLGIGSTQIRGDTSDEMGAGLLPVNLGNGKTATLLAVGNAHACAILNDSTVKCWGYNISGTLGIGDTANRGDAAGEMADSLPAVSLGTGRTARALSPGSAHTCALLDDNTIKCWGYNAQGQLGLSDAQNRGDGASEMGDLLKPTFVTF